MKLPTPDNLLTEKNIQDCIQSTAKTLGFELQYHTYRSKRSPTGFLDLVLVKAPRVVFIECKGWTGKLTKDKVNLETGRIDYGQESWIAELKKCPGVEVYTAWPNDWLSGRIANILSAGPKRKNR